MEGEDQSTACLWLGCQCLALELDLRGCRGHWFLAHSSLMVKAHLKLQSSQGQYTKLCIIGKVSAQPGSERQRKAVSDFRTAYKAISSFIVSLVLKRAKFIPQPLHEQKPFVLTPPLPPAIDKHVPFCNSCGSCNQCKSLEEKYPGAPEGSFMHVLWALGPFTFYILCGVHTRVTVRKLASSCPRRATTVAMCRALVRMKHGLHPTEDFLFGHPAFFSVAFLPSSPGENPSTAPSGAVDGVPLGEGDEEDSD